MMHVNFRIVDGGSSRAVVIAGVVVERFPASESEFPKTGVAYDKFVNEGYHYSGPDRFDDCWHYKEQQKKLLGQRNATVLVFPAKSFSVTP